VRAAVTRGPGEMVVMDVAGPGPPGAGGVIVRPEAVGICGSDLHYPTEVMKAVVLVGARQRDGRESDA
jgi:threonine dehydrogenase-like Zn-dependent dehydrogenase